MPEVPMRRCPHCQQRRPERWDTRDGELIDLTPPCLCPAGRKAAGICRDCLEPVEGTVGKALRCAQHKREARRRAGRTSGRKYREKRRRWEREYRQRPEVRARRRIQQRRWRAENREKVRRQKRKDAIRNSERISRYMLDYNRRRRKEMRLYMKRYNVYGPDNPPTCADCDAEVPFSGRGRPHKRCPDCDPKSWERDQSGKNRKQREAA